MGAVKEKAQEIAIKQALKEIRKNPKENLPKLLQFVEKFICNFIVNSAIKGIDKTNEVKEREGCGIPWAIVMDPTTACNMKCTGCWAAEYGKSLNLGLETMDKIVTQGKELGTYWYLFTGGEPLVKKEEILTLCRKHSDCIFVAFTNATLIDEEFARQVREVGNLSSSISVEGTEESTDARRGKGTYQKVMKAMDILKKGGCIAGGKHYMHINANGDVEPCVFIHYSNANIKDMDLLDTLKQPIFREYQKNQPFHDNLLRPCPLLDNSGKLAEMVHKCGAHSTDLLHPEDVDSLCAKCQKISKEWGETADKLWETDPRRKEVEDKIRDFRC